MADFYAVLDVGKTNKKALVFDENLKVVESEYVNIPAEDSGRLQIEKTDQAVDWFLGELAKFAGKYAIRAISVTTHGATFACVGEDGKLSVPVISYTNDPGTAFNDQFYAKYGDAAMLHRKTATACMGGLANLAKGIEFARKEFPEQFARSKYILNYPQYFGYVLTGAAGADTTYTACHTYLWNFKQKKYSSVAKAMGIAGLLPEKIGFSHNILGTIKPEIAARTGLHKNTVVTYGIHDSNASLLPYLLTEKGRFILNSTGTWFVTMCPSEKVSFRKNELEAGVFYNADVFGNPVKTSIFMAGGELDYYYDILKKSFGLKGHPDFDHAFYQKLISDAKTYVMPGLLAGTGPFPKSRSRIIDNGQVFFPEEIAKGAKRPESFGNPEYGYAAVVLSLALQTEVMLKNTGLKKGMTVYIEGGFRKNKAYCSLLTAFCPGVKFILSDMPEATSFGAALLAKSACSKIPLNQIAAKIRFSTEDVAQSRFKDLHAYSDAFLNWIGK